MIDFGMEVTEVDPSSPPPKTQFTQYSDREERNSSCHFGQDTCFICNNQCYPQSFSSNPSPAFALWALEIREALYDAFNIQVDPSFFQEFHGELPLCPQCSFKVGTLKSVQKQISDLQSSYDRIRADMAFSITEIITAGNGSKSRYEPHNSDTSPTAFKSDSPTELLNSFRESEVKTLQQLVYQSWHDRYVTETEEPAIPVHSPAPPSLTREGSPEKFNFQMPVRNEVPKQYRNKKLEVAEQAQKNVINLGNSGRSQSLATNNNGNGVSPKQKAFVVPHVILPSTTIDLHPPHQQLTSDDENEEETDRLQLDDRVPMLSPPHIVSQSPSSTNPEILTVVNGFRLPTLTLSMSPRLFCPTESPSGFHSKSKTEGAQLTIEKYEEHDAHLAALSTNVEITEADLNEYSDDELEEEPRDDDDEVEEEEEEEENENESEELDVGSTLKLVENYKREQKVKDEEPEPKPRRSRKSKLTSRKTSTDSSSCEHSDLKQNHEGLYVCNFCDKTFIHKYPYRDHLKTHTGEGPKCKLCLKIFPKKHNLMLHMRTHTGEKPYKCEVCRKGFADKSNLKVHMRVHTGERPYQCEYCNLTFVNSSRLVVHRRLHTGEKPFPCGICHRTFITSNQLASHTKNHFNGKPYKCDECGKGYSGKIGLQSHINTYHGV